MLWYAAISKERNADMWELVIVWAFGDDRTQVFRFDTKEEAEKAGENYRMAFGNQVAWFGVRPVTW